MIAIFVWIVFPVCLVASIVQLWLLSLTGAFTHVKQLRRYCGFPTAHDPADVRVTDTLMKALEERAGTHATP